MEIFVLDTNIFFNFQPGIGLGQNTSELLEKLVLMIKPLKSNRLASFYMTPKIIDEFLSFFKDKDDQKAKDFLSLTEVESPDLGKMLVNGFVLERIFEEVRQRAYRGLNIAEEEIVAVAKEFQEKKIDNQKDFQIAIGKFIRNFRDRYRKTTRQGFIDSLADFEAVALAKQKEGFLVSTDEGVIKWARIFGVKEMLPSVFSKRLEWLLQSHLGQAGRENQSTFQ
ncbi:MAG: RNA ligase partner protein [Patescibacteria group bacterium]|nr:RNA ligase partner protein [Patescibacteria group bacterium]